MLGRAVYHARALNPRAEVLVRTKRVEDGPELERAGASHIVSEEMEAAEEIIIHLLHIFGIPRREAYEQVRAARAETQPARVE